MDGGKSVTSLLLSGLAPGDCVVLRTANSTYSFWVEFPAEAIGIMSGGCLTAPRRVRLAPEGVSISLGAEHPLEVGERAQTAVLGPTGTPIRNIVTSTIASITLIPASRAAA